MEARSRSSSPVMQAARPMLSKPLGRMRADPDHGGRLVLLSNEGRPGMVERSVPEIG